MKSKRILLDVGKPGEQEISVSKKLSTRIIGQKGGREAAARAYRAFLNPLRDKRRPVYVMYALGESGEGKTLLARSLARFLHGDEKAMIKINAGNYKEKHRVSQLLGAPPSYVGYKDPTDPKEAPKAGKIDTTAKLSMHNKVASRRGSTVPVTVVLIDECEKMHEDLEQVLLSIFEDGEVDFGNNTVGDFTDCIFILTGNIASREISKLNKAPMGFGRDVVVVTQEMIGSTVTKVLEDRYAPEFLNRIDEVVIFERLTPEQLRQVVDVEVDELMERMTEALPRGMAFTLDVKDSARDFILAESLKRKGGARNIRRTVSRLVGDALGNELIKRTLSLGDLVEVEHEGDATALSFYKTEDEADVADADRMVLHHGDTNDTRKGLSFQRRNDAALKKAGRAKTKKVFRITVKADSKEELSNEFGHLVMECFNVFGLQVIQTSNAWEAPFVATATVRGIDEQIKMLEEKYSNVEIEEQTENAGVEA